jgi:hypothetical protein
VDGEGKRQRYILVVVNFCRMCGGVGWYLAFDRLPTRSYMWLGIAPVASGSTDSSGGKTNDSMFSGKLENKASTVTIAITFLRCITL